MLHLYTLGGLRLGGDVAPPLSSRRKELALLAYLARKGPKPLRRAELADLFWGDRDDRRARQSLRQALLELKRLLNGALEVDAETATLLGSAVELDANQFEADLAAGRLEEAVTRWKGDFLAEVDDLGGEAYRLWLERERELLRRSLARGMDGLVVAAEGCGDWASAARWAASWVEFLPSDERARLELIRALRIDGRSADALTAYLTYVTLLKDELGLAPSADLTRVGEQLQQEASKGPASLPTAAALFTPDLTGREGAFRELVRGWSIARSGAVSVVVIDGEAGIGKTRLGDEFLRWVESQPERVLVLRARAYRAERDRPWRTARDLFAELDRAPGIVSAPPGTLAALAELVPSIRDRFPALPAPSAALDDAVRQALTDVAAEVPVLAFLDDLPAADEPSRELIASLVRRPPPGVLLMLTGRPEDWDSLASLSELRSLPAVGTLRLPRLGRVEIETILGSMIELPPGDRHELGARLYSESGGNPLHVIELVRVLVDEGHLGPDRHGVWRLSPGLADVRLPLPPTLRDAVGRRVSRLSPAARGALDAAASLGLPFGPELLGAVADLSPVAVEAAIGELIVRRLIQEARGVPGQFECSDELVRRQVSESVAIERAEELSRRAASALEERAATDTAARAALAHHRARAPRRAPRWRKAGLGLAAAAMVVGAIRLGPMWFRQPLPTSPTTVAVLPFSVRGSPELAYLGEGMATLLAPRLDVTDALRGADSRAVLGIAAQDGGGSPDAARARRVAERLGAGTYVLGDIVGVNGKVRIEAAAYRLGDREPVARAEVEGTPGELFTLVDALAGDLLGDLVRGPNPQLTRLAGTTTQSLSALKAYLEGEKHFREGRFLPAVDAFQRATEDTTFALAQYWLSVAAWWADQPELVQPAAERAVRHAARLSERDRRLLEAWDTFLRGDALEAERRYRALLGVEPENVEAWAQLGEVVFHYGPRRGRPLVDARQPFQRVLFFQPEHSSALLHLARVAASVGDTVALDSLARRILALNASGDWALEARSLRAFTLGDRAETQQVLAELADASDGRIWNVARYVGVSAHNTAGARELIRLLIDPSRAPEARAFGHIGLAYLAIAEGRIHDGLGELDRAAPLDPVSALEHRALVLALPFAPAPRGEIRAACDALLAWHPTAPAGSGVTAGSGRLHGEVEPHLRAYLLGVLSLRLEEDRAAAGYLTRLSQLPAGPEAAGFASGAVEALEAQRAWRAHDTGAAVGHFEQALKLETRVGLIGSSPFYARSFERYRFAQLLEELGRDEDATRWYSSFADNSIFDLAYLAPSHFRRGEIAERAGAREIAAEHYRRVVGLWSSADPALRPLVDSARERLTRLATPP